MQRITINLPEKYLEAIQILNDLKIYPSRSEAIRCALENFLSKELRLDQELLDKESLTATFSNRKMGGRN